LLGGGEKCFIIITLTTFADYGLIYFNFSLRKIIMDIQKITEARYSTKKFDPAKKSARRI